MRAMKGYPIRRLLTAVSMLGWIALAGCEDMFDVKNPGAILDEDLNDPKGVQTLVTGMSGDFSASYDGLAFLVARGSDEMAGSGSYFLTGLVRRGLIGSEDVDGYWEGVQRARWVAEAGLERMKEIEGYDFDGNPLTARAYLFAGLANRWFGENFCYVVYSSPYETDDGTAQPKEVAFQRAIGHFEKALEHAQKAGATDYVYAAHGGLAQAYVGLGDWDKAVQHASQVPTEFVFVAYYSDNSGREENQIVIETHLRAEMSVYGTYIATLGENGDPRTPWTDCTTPGTCRSGHQGADGETPHYQQEKYPELGSDIPLIKGTEMRLIEAEAALRNQDLTTAMAKINEVRAFHGLPPLTATGVGTKITGDWNSMTGWDILDRERLLTLWLEGRRLWDHYRWDHPSLYCGRVVYAATVAKRYSCLPIADSECQVNEKVKDLCVQAGG